MASVISIFLCRDFRAAAVFFFLLATSLSSSESTLISGSVFRDLALLIPAVSDSLRAWKVAGGRPGEDFCRTIGELPADGREFTEVKLELAWSLSEGSCENWS